MKPLFSDAKMANSSATPAAQGAPAVLDIPSAFTVVTDLTPLNLVSEQALLPAVAPRTALTVAAPRVTDEQVSQLGEQAVTALSSVSSKLLGHVRASDAADFGKGLSQLVVTAKGIDPSDLANKGFLGRLRGTLSSAKEHLVAQYATVERQMDTLVVELDAKASLHRTRINDMEQIYVANVDYHTQLEAAANAGEDLLVTLRADYETQTQVAISDSFGAQRLADHQRIIERLDKRVDDLRRAMLLAKQAAPQIRLMQENARSLVQKFGDVKTVTLPAWKNAFSLYVLQLEQQAAAKLLGEVDDVTDAALRKSADLLRENTESIARSRQRAVVTVETLEHIQTQLLGSVEDVKRIEQEGKAAREAEKPKLLAMEKELIAAFAPGKR